MSEVSLDDDSDYAAPSEVERKGSVLPLLMGCAFGVVLLAGAGALGWALQSPPMLMRGEQGEAAFGAKFYYLQPEGDPSRATFVLLPPHVTGYGNSAGSGESRISWSGLGKSYEYRAELQGDQLVIWQEPDGERLVVPREGALLLQVTGPILLEQKDLVFLDMLAANPPIYLGLDLVNTAPKGSPPRGAEVPAGTEVEIGAVQPDSPAAAAGLLPGDVILAVHTRQKTHEVLSRRQLAAWLADVLPHLRVTFTIRREGKTSEVTVRARRRELAEFVSDHSAAVSDDLQYFKWR